MGRTIAITGSGAGLGKHLAQRFASDGDTVVLLGRTMAKIEDVAAGLGNGAFAVQCDVASPDSVRAAFATVAARTPSVDVLINNAAVFEPALVAEASDEHIQKTLNTNLLGAIYCVRSAIPLMTAGGHIINVSSESVDMPFAHLILYQASKAGLENFSANLHRELETSGIRVTVVRAGQMMDEDKTWDIDPEAAARFAKANIEAGLNLRGRPHTHFKSATDVFRSLIDMPADLHVAKVQMHAFRSV